MYKKKRQMAITLTNNRLLPDCSIFREGALKQYVLKKALYN